MRTRAQLLWGRPGWRGGRPAGSRKSWGGRGEQGGGGEGPPGWTPCAAGEGAAGWWGPRSSQNRDVCRSVSSSSRQAEREAPVLSLRPRSRERLRRGDGVAAQGKAALPPGSSWRGRRSAGAAGSVHRARSETGLGLRAAGTGPWEGRADCTPQNSWGRFGLPQDGEWDQSRRKAQEA